MHSFQKITYSASILFKIIFIFLSHTCSNLERWSGGVPRSMSWTRSECTVPTYIQWWCKWAPCPGKILVHTTGSLSYVLCLSVQVSVNCRLGYLDKFSTGHPEVRYVAVKIYRELHSVSNTWFLNSVLLTKTNNWTTFFLLYMYLSLAFRQVQFAWS